MKKLKHITVNQEVYLQLKNLGKAGDSFNDVLFRILSATVTEQEWKEGGSNNKKTTTNSSDVEIYPKNFDKINHELRAHWLMGREAARNVGLKIN